VLDGYLHKEGPPVGEMPASRQLTAREREIVQLLAEGKTCRGVAESFRLERENGGDPPEQYYAETGTASVSDLVLFAIRNNIVHVSEPQK